MIINNIKLSWHFFKQEYGQSHQRLLRWVQGILLLFIVTLSQTSDSIQQYLDQNLQGLLGADMVLSQKQALTQQQFSEVFEQVDDIVVTQQIKTMLTHNGQWQQVQLKAVDNNYPLQGELLTSTSLTGEGQPSSTGPKPGQIWADARLLAGLSIKLGEKLVVADTPLTLSRIIQHEPDRLMEGHNVDMRVMVNATDFVGFNFSDDLIQYRYLLAASPTQISRIIDWQKQELPAAEIYHKQGQHPLALFWQRTENFMGLASVILFFMAAIAIEQLSQVFMKKDQFFTAVCMSFGVSKKTGIFISITKWIISLIVLTPVVLAFSMLSHYVIIQFLNDTFPDLTWQLAPLAALKSVGVVGLVFAVFQAPVWVSLYKSSVAEQFNGNEVTLNHWVNKLASLCVLFIVAFTYSDNGLLTFMMLSAVAITIVLMILISWGGLTLGEKATSSFSGLVPFTLFMMKQRLLSKSTQILGVGLCAFLLLFTLMLLKDIGNTMSVYQRQHDGNVFVSQASEPQMRFIEHWAKNNNINVKQTKPYMHAKLISINELSVSEYSEKPSDSLSTFSKSIRLHWSELVPGNNVLADGQWWQRNTDNWQQISIEQEVMTDLGLVIGDKLTFFINKQHVEFEIVASHEFKPGAGSITFWVQMPPAALNHINATTYNMASIELAENQWPLLAPLWQKFPTLRMVSLKELTQLFDNTLAMITKVISGFSLMIILLAGVVILSSIKGLESKEKKKNSVIMSFGFSRKTCLQLNVIEWGVTALITAIGAIVGTYLAGVLIYQSQFSLTYQPNAVWLLVTLFTILSSFTALGVYATRHNLKSSVRELLASS